MLLDVTGVELTPGNCGRDCAGSGARGGECCCDECDYALCCESEDFSAICAACGLAACPRKAQ